MSLTLIWTIVMVVAIIVEAITVDLVSIWFAVGSCVALVAELLGLSQTIQIVLFAAVSILCIIVTRPLSKKYLKTNIIKTNLDRVVGEHCLVTETITPDEKGEIKVMGQLWAASSVDNMVIEKGQQAEVIAIEGSHVVVKSI